MTSFKKKIAFAGVALAVVLAGCTSKPLYNVDNAPVTSASGKSLKADQVKGAIVAAASSLGWRISDQKPGHIEATLNLREHEAVVDIPYSATSYSIKFKSGKNIGEKEGQIHRNYNGWVQNLDNKIRAELLRL